jgi:hypothetical protein
MFHKQRPRHSPGSLFDQLGPWAAEIYYCAADGAGAADGAAETAALGAVVAGVEAAGAVVAGAVVSGVAGAIVVAPVLSAGAAGVVIAGVLLTVVLEGCVLAEKTRYAIASSASATTIPMNHAVELFSRE